MDKPLILNVGGNSHDADFKHAAKGFLIHGIVTIAILGGILPLAFTLIGHAFTTPTPYCDYPGYFLFNNFAGVLLFYFVGPFGVISYGASLTYIPHIVKRWGKGATTLVLMVYMAIALAWILVSLISFIRPWYALLPSTDPRSQDQFQMILGSFLVVVFTLLLGVCLKYTVQLHCPQQRSQETNPPSPRRCGANAKGIALLVFILLCCFCMTAVFSPVWNYSARSYFTYNSEYSLLPQGSKTAALILKTYTDVVVYYGFLGVIILFGVLAHFVSGFRRCCHRRVRCCSPSMGKSWNPFPHGATVGEVFLILMWVGLAVFWIIYWRFLYGRINGGEEKNDRHANLQSWARAFGHVASFMLSFLTFPVARHSLWERVFGMPYERALKYHRGLGCFAWMATTVHMLIWWVKWAMEGFFWNNIVTITNLKIADPVSVPPMKPVPPHEAPDCLQYQPGIHYDNFTIPLTELGWLTCTVMIVIAYYARRKNYELFRYTHFLAISFFLIAVSHAWAFWYFAIGGGILYVLDRAARLNSAMTTTQVESIHASGGLTAITLRLPPWRHYAGQYAFVAVPALSKAQWHPFTISSPPSADSLTFHIKAMGPNTWTGRLYELARASSASGILPTVMLNGPYGRPPYPDMYEQIILVGGGIGVTPLVSILQDLHDRMTQGKADDLPLLKHVKLVWAIRDPGLLHHFSPTLTEIAHNNVREMFSVDIYSTHHKRAESRLSQSSRNLSLQLSESVQDLAVNPAAGIAHSVNDLDGEIQTTGVELSTVWPNIQSGRPSLTEIFRQLSQTAAGTNTLVMTCGPLAMIDSASEAAHEYGFDFHHEIFHF